MRDEGPSEGVVTISPVDSWGPGTPQGPSPRSRPAILTGWWMVGWGWWEWRGYGGGQAGGGRVQVVVGDG